MKKMAAILIALLINAGASLADETVPSEPAAVSVPDVPSDQSSSLSFREQLVINKKVTKVIPIDANYTHVMPSITAFGFGSGDINKDVTKSIVSACDTKWLVKDFDPLTSKTGWVPWNGKSSIYTRTIEDKLTKKTKNISGAKCVDRFEITDVWGEYRSLYSDGTGRFFSPKNFIIKHETPQPNVSKNKDLPKKITMLPEGEIKKIGKSGGLGGILSGMLMEGSNGSADTFQYVTELCQQGHGTPQTVIAHGVFKQDPRGRAFSADGVPGLWKSVMTEVDTVEAYRHAFAGGLSADNVEKEWYFACTGATPFVVRERENTVRDGQGKPHVEISRYFSPGRTLDGVDFVKKQP